MKKERLVHPEETETVFNVVVDGKIVSTTKVYDYAYNRALGIALYLGLEFENTKSPDIRDKWAGEGHMVVVFKIEE